MTPLTVVVMAHGAAQRIFDRHMAFWESHGAPILVICPENDTVKTRHTRYSSRKAQHHGPEAHLRNRSTLQILSTIDSEFFLIFEYDSFCLNPTPNLQRGLSGVVFKDRDRARWMASRYATPPWMVDRLSLAAMESVAEEYPALTEEGFADRYFSALADLNGIPILHHSPPGFSRTTITSQDLSLLKSAIESGSSMIHGVKDSWVLHYIEETLAASSGRASP